MDDNGGDAMETEISDGAGEETAKSLSIFVEEGSVESIRYYLARRTLLHMLRDRGYDIPDSKFQLTIRQFRELHGQNIDVDHLRFTASHASDSQDKVLVVFCGTDVVRKNDMYHVQWVAAQTMNKQSFSLIIVVQSRVTLPAIKFVESLPFKVEMFQIFDLLVNITRDVLKPEQRVIADNGKEKVLKKQLPRMSQKDPIAQNYAAEKGKVTEVTNQQSFSQIPTFNSQPFPDSQPIPATQSPKPFPDSQPIRDTQPPKPFPDSQPIRDTQPPKPFPDSQPIHDTQPPKSFPDSQPPIYDSIPKTRPLPPKKNMKTKRFKRKRKRPITKTTPIVVPPQHLTSPEEEALARAWIYVFEDRITSNSQKFDSFWDRITLHFHSIMGKGEYRTQHQLCTKFHEMMKRTVKFCSIYNNFLTNRKSGWNDTDILSKAHEQYQTDEGTSFNHLSVWQIVKDDPKWAILLELIEKVGGDSKHSKTNNDHVSTAFDARTNIDLNVEENDDPILSHVEPTHSMGRDKAEGATERGLSSSSFVDMLAIKLGFFSTNYLEIEKQKIELRKRKIDENVRGEDWKILTGDTSNLPEHVRIAAEALRGKVVKKYNPNM